MSPGAVDPFGPNDPDMTSRDDPARRPKTPDWQVRRDRSVWYGVVGIGLLFAGNISTAFAVGGVLMVVFGIMEYTRWSLKRPKEEDPWRDTDIDAWEEQHYGEGDGLDEEAESQAPEVVDANPDEAWGLHEKRF